MLSQERKIKMASKRVKQSIILSVSVMKGCYRHIQVSVNEDLETLADIILWAFDFDNDHAHAFFMDNKAWSNYDCYYMAEVDEDEMYIRISRCGLSECWLLQESGSYYDLSACLCSIAHGLKPVSVCCSVAVGRLIILIGQSVF